VIFFIEVLLV